MAKISSVFNKMNIIFLILLLAIVMVGEFVLEGMHLPTWPAFIVMIFFFMAHMNMKEVPAILLGSAFGMINLILIESWVVSTVPLLGGNLTKYTDPHTVEAIFYSKLIYIALFISLIVFLKDILPWIFNNYAFMSFTIAAAISGGHTAAAIAAKTVAGHANAVVAAGGDPAVIEAMKGATDKAIASSVPVTNVYQWIGIELIGGACFVLGIYGILKFLAKLQNASPKVQIAK